MFAESLENKWASHLDCLSCCAKTEENSTRLVKFVCTTVAWFWDVVARVDMARCNREVKFEVV